MPELLSLAFKQDAMDAAFSGTERVVLLRSTYVFNPAHRFLADIPAADRSGTVRELRNAQAIANAANNSITLTADDFTEENGNAFDADPDNLVGALWIFTDTGDEATSVLVRFADFDFVQMEEPLQVRFPNGVVFVWAG